MDRVGSKECFLSKSEVSTLPSRYSQLTYMCFCGEETQSYAQIFGAAELTWVLLLLCEILECSSAHNKE